MENDKKNKLKNWKHSKATSQYRQQHNRWTLTANKRCKKKSKNTKAKYLWNVWWTGIKFIKKWKHKSKLRNRRNKWFVNIFLR
jgi:hypothetical protein